jgi:DNA polymerase III subunit chi
MTEIRFYHLLRKPLEQALPELLEKTLERGWRAVVLAGSSQRVEALDQHLWTYDDRSFLPHGSAAEGEPDLQPIWLTDRDENPNGAQVLIQVDGAATAEPGRYARICDLFDGNDPDAVTAARSRWKRFKDGGHALTYWQQTDRGRWEQKA